MPKTIVIGLGNPILTDDGVGVRVARRVAEALADAGRDDVTVTEAGGGGLRLMELMEGYDRAVLVDALAGEAPRPGTLHTMTLRDLHTVSPTQHTASAHDTTLATALDAGRRLGVPLPEDVVVYAVEVENVVDFGEALTPAVAEAVPRVAAAVLDALDRL